jgi:hypothetical protein
MNFREPKDLSRSCVGCKGFYDIIVESSDYKAWRDGMLIQTAFPYLSVDLREILISGICGICFDEIAREYK